MIALSALVFGGCCALPTNAHGSSTASTGRAANLLLWNGRRALDDIAAQLSLGSRSLGATGHEKAIKYIEKELAKTKATVRVQRWDYIDSQVKRALTNIIGRFDVSNPRRIVVGTHFDSIVRAYRDSKNPNAPMPGANNSASGVAVLLETARALSESRLLPNVGIDLVFFDGEEGRYSLGAGDKNWFPLGSPYFAKHIEKFYPRKLPESAAIFDMVCYKNLRLRIEPYSARSAPNDVRLFWSIGKKISPSVFSDDPTPSAIADDQIALGKLGVPSFLVIDFDYEPWFNTTQDTIDKCSSASLQAVGRTLLQYLYSK